MKTEGWTATLKGGDYHVTPNNDVRAHDMRLSCWCRPTRDDENYATVVHHSADGREDYETGERKPH